MIAPILKDAFIYGALPAALVIAGGSAALFTSPRARLLDAIRKFAAGALFAVIALELMPDLLFAHHAKAVTFFAAGVIGMIAVRWMTGKLSRRVPGESRQQHASLIIEAFIYILIAGLLIGSSFVAGIREGSLLTMAMAVEGLAIGLTLAVRLSQSGVRRRRIISVLIGLGGLLFAGVAGGATLLRGHSEIDLDVLLAFGMAALLVVGLEALIETRDDPSPSATLLYFVAGMLLFLVLAGRLGGRHPHHPEIRGEHKTGIFEER